MSSWQKSIVLLVTCTLLLLALEIYENGIVEGFLITIIFILVAVLIGIPIVKWLEQEEEKKEK